ncbi:hypothetical protein B0T21DRAFT_378437 [Apiosordaria backusii]|uniref:Uncharacterized protein n=1 Tax=Apiosordaria backusii TaxID=314023 RepID=A0AA40DGV1_9PEZI|nr:hypothetical protein B0T21DRAFT_378437 [Apiosordaria backusii]
MHFIHRVPQPSPAIAKRRGSLQPQRDPSMLKKNIPSQTSLPERHPGLLHLVLQRQNESEPQPRPTELPKPRPPLPSSGDPARQTIEEMRAILFAAIRLFQEEARTHRQQKEGVEKPERELKGRRGNWIAEKAPRPYHVHNHGHGAKEFKKHVVMKLKLTPMACWRKTSEWRVILVIVVMLNLGSVGWASETMLEEDKIVGKKGSAMLLGELAAANKAEESIFGATDCLF